MVIMRARSGDAPGIIATCTRPRKEGIVKYSAAIVVILCCFGIVARWLSRMDKSMAIN